MAEGKPGNQRNVEYFDSVSQRYRSFYDERRPLGTGFRLRRQRVLELFDKPGGTVLDVGCGPGVIVDELLARGCMYFGIDSAPGMVEQARKHFGSRASVHLSVASGEQTGFPDRWFDAVVCMGVLDRANDSEAIVREMVRVLKIGGTLIVTLPNKRSPYIWAQDLYFSSATSLARRLYDRASGGPRRPIGPRRRAFSAASFSRRVAQHGCAVTDVVYTGFAFVPPPFDRLFPSWAARSMARFESLSHGRLRSTAFSFIVKATKS